MFSVARRTDPLASFTGTFSGWFFGRQYFLTRQSTVVRLYDRDGTVC